MSDSQIGLAFKFKNVNYYDLNMDKNTVSVGINVHVIVEVKSLILIVDCFILIQCRQIKDKKVDVRDIV